MSALDLDRLELAVDLLSLRDGDDGQWLSGAEVACVVRWLRHVQRTARAFGETLASTRLESDALDWLLDEGDLAAQALADLVVEALPNWHGEPDPADEEPDGDPP